MPDEVTSADLVEAKVDTGRIRDFTNGDENATWTDNASNVRPSMRKKVNDALLAYDVVNSPVNWTASTLISDVRTSVRNDGATYIPNVAVPFTTGATFTPSNWKLWPETLSAVTDTGTRLKLDKDFIDIGNQDGATKGGTFESTTSQLRLRFDSSDLDIWTDGVGTALEVDGTTGNVGVGRKASVAKFEVNGNVRAAPGAFYSDTRTKSDGILSGQTWSVGIDLNTTDLRGVHIFSLRSTGTFHTQSAGFIVYKDSTNFQVVTSIKENEGNADLDVVVSSSGDISVINNGSSDVSANVEFTLLKLSLTTTF